MNLPYFTKVALLAALFGTPAIITVQAQAHEADESSATKAAKPYVGRVKGDSVRLRTGAGTNHPPIYVCDKDEEVVVVGAKDGWTEVRLPKNAPCWVASEFVTVSADGKSYSVKGDKVNLRGSADTVSFPIGQVLKGAELTACIDGQTGKAIVTEKYVRVIAPAQAHGFVASEFVEKVREIAPEKLPEVAKPADRAVDPNATVEKPGTGPVSDATGDVIPPKPEDKKPEVKRAPTKEELEDERKTFDELKVMLRDELRKPAADVNLTNLRKLFEQYAEFALDEKLGAEAKKYIERIDSTVAMVDAEKKRLADEQAKREAEIERIKKEALTKKEEPQDTGPVVYIAKGTVGATGKLAKTPASHRLFDDAGNVLYDIRWDKGDLSKYMGKYIGITGEVKEYDGWPNKVIVIKRVDVLIQDDDK